MRKVAWLPRTTGRADLDHGRIGFTNNYVGASNEFVGGARIPFSAPLTGSQQQWVSSTPGILVARYTGYASLAFSVSVSGYTGSVAPKVTLRRKVSGSFTENFIGNVAVQSYVGTSTFRFSAASPPLVVTAGDEFEVIIDSRDASTITIVAAQSYFSIRPISMTYGALIRRNNDQTAQNYTGAGAAPSLDGEGLVTGDYDLGGWHDNVSNAGRLNAPAAVNGLYGLVKGSIRLANVTAGNLSQINLERNGSSSFNGYAAQAARQDLTGAINCVFSGPIQLATSDYFRMLQFLSSDTSADLVAAQTWLGIEVLDGLASGVMLKKAADQTTADYRFSNAMAWDSEVYDIGGWHSGSDEFITVPPDTNWLQCGGNVRWTLGTAAATYNALWITKEGSADFDGACGQQGAYNTTGGNINLISGPIPVTPGEKLRLNFLQTTDNSITISAALSNFWARRLA